MSAINRGLFIPANQVRGGTWAPTGWAFAESDAGRKIHRTSKPDSGFDAWTSVCGQWGDFKHGSIYDWTNEGDLLKRLCKKCWPGGLHL